MFSVPLLVVLGLVFAYLAAVSFRVYLKYRKVAAERERTEKEYILALQRERELRQKIDYLRSDFGKERELRKRFNLAKPGERVFIIVDKEVEQNDGKEGVENWLFSGLFKKIKEILGF